MFKTPNASGVELVSDATDLERRHKDIDLRNSVSKNIENCSFVESVKYTNYMAVIRES